jgi:putative PIG3 family NAD(P)H quinone oxidoreductase
LLVYAVTIPSYGDPEVLTWEAVPDPVAGPGEVLLDVVASAVNRADLLQRQGSYPPPAGAPPYPGLECSGRIAALGDGVTGWQVGDQVCALLSGGGYAEKVAVPAGHLLPVPAGVSLADAAALPEVACTVWSNVVDVAGLAAGEVLLVHGAGSGVGTFAVQLGHALGATVCGTARVDKHDALRRLGAEVLVDYNTDDFVSDVKRATDGHGADVVLDIIGAAYLSRNIDVLAPGGHIVVIGLQGGRKAEVDLAALMAKRATVTGTTLRARPPEQKTAIVRAVRDEVWPLIDSGEIRPVIDRKLSVTDVAEAHRIVAASDHIGKILLTISD